MFSYQHTFDSIYAFRNIELHKATENNGIDGECKFNHIPIALKQMVNEFYSMKDQLL